MAVAGGVFMRVIRRYLLRTIFSMTALVMTVLLGLAGFIEFVGQLDDVGVGDYGVLQALLYAAMKLPGLAFVMLPMAALLGALLGLGSLANYSELTAMRAAGVSVMRLARGVAVTGVVIALITLVLGEYVAPPLDQYSRQYRTLSQQASAGLPSAESAWIREGNTILNINLLNRDYRLGGVFLFKLDAGGRLTGMARGDSAGIDDAGQWVLNNYAETTITGDGVVTRHKRRTSQSTTLNPELVELTVIRPDSLDGLQLFHYVAFLRANGLDAQRYSAAFWGRIASSVAVVPMVVLALPFVFGRMRSAGAGARMVIGILIGLAYFFASRSLMDGGEVYNLNPAVVAWVPTLLLTGCVMVALWRVR
jgi:lipopolysaccharide export system permease protein